MAYTVETNSHVLTQNKTIRKHVANEKLHKPCAAPNMTTQEHSANESQVLNKNKQNVMLWQL